MLISTLSLRNSTKIPKQELDCFAEINNRVRWTVYSGQTQKCNRTVCDFNKARTRCISG